MRFVDYPGNFVAVLLMALFAGILVWAFMSREVRKAKLWLILLWFAQFAAVIILLLILWNPSRPEMSETAAKNTVIVLFDTSESMSVVDGKDKTRLELAVETFNQKFNPFDPDGPVYKIYGFDSGSFNSDSARSLWERFASSSNNGAFRQWGRQTDLHGAVSVLEKFEIANAVAESDKDGRGAAGKVLGAVIFTDGQADDKNANTYLPPRSKDMKVTFVGVGSNKAQADVAVTSIKVPSRVAIESSYKVQVSVTGKNIQDQAATLELLKDDYVISTIQIPPDKLTDTIREEFYVGADVLGRHTISAKVTVPGNEVNQANNVRRAMVEVTENAKRKVLFYSQVVNFNIGKVRQALSRDKKIELDLGLDVIKSDDLASKSQAKSGYIKFPSERSDFYKYDVIILGPCAVDRLKKEQIDGLYSFVVDRGGGLILLPGKAEYGPLGWKDEKVRSLLPVLSQFAPGSSGRFAGRMELSEEGSDSKIISKAVLGDYDETACTYYQGVTKKPAATTLVTVRDKPIIAAHRVGRGRVCLINASAIFRWYREDLKGGLLHEFVSGLTSYVGRMTSREAAVELFVERKGGHRATVRFDAFVQDNTYAGVDGATVLLSYDDEVYRMEPTGGGYYSAEVDNVLDEAVVATAQAQLNGGFLGERTIAVNLPAVRNEMTDVDLDAKFLNALAKRFKGNYIHLSDIKADVSKNYESQTQVTSLSRMLSVWPRWSVMMVLCAVLCTGWFIKRAKGLV